MGKNLLDTCEHPAFKDLVYVLAFYHAVVQVNILFGDLNRMVFHACFFLIGEKKI